MFPVQAVPSPDCIFWGKYLLLGKVGVVFGREPSLESKTVSKRGHCHLELSELAGGGECNKSRGEQLALNSTRCTQGS